jgi:hypothetical protein
MENFHHHRRRCVRNQRDESRHKSCVCVVWERRAEIGLDGLGQDLITFMLQLGHIGSNLAN